MSREVAMLLLAGAGFYLYSQSTFSKLQGDFTAGSYTNVTTTEMVAIAAFAIGAWELV